MRGAILIAAAAALLFGAAAQAQQVPYSVCKYPKVCPPDTYPMPMPPKSSLPTQRAGHAARTATALQLMGPGTPVTGAVRTGG